MPGAEPVDGRAGGRRGRVLGARRAGAASPRRRTPSPPSSGPRRATSRPRPTPSRPRVGRDRRLRSPARSTPGVEPRRDGEDAAEVESGRAYTGDEAAVEPPGARRRAVRRVGAAERRTGVVAAPAETSPVPDVAPIPAGPKIVPAAKPPAPRADARHRPARLPAPARRRRQARPRRSRARRPAARRAPARPRASRSRARSPTTSRSPAPARTGSRSPPAARGSRSSSARAGAATPTST